MGDWLEAVVDTHATKDDSVELGKRAIEVLISEQIVKPELDPDSVLGGKGGYRPGKRIPEVYERSEREGKFWELTACGVEIETGPWFNTFGTTSGFEIKCPFCDTRFDFGDPFGDRLGRAIGDFLNGNPSPLVVCPACQTETAVRTWRSKTHLGFSYLTFIFWNWPPLDSSSWKIDFPKLIESALGHEVVLTYGRV